MKELKNKILNGDLITKQDALTLIDAPLDELCQNAYAIQLHFMKDQFDLCSIANGKSGQCSEDCKFCAQSSHYPTQHDHYPLLNTEELLKEALHNDQQGVKRFSIVTSGKNLTKQELYSLCLTYKEIKHKSSISLCSSNGLLTKEDFIQLKQSGVTRYHNNLETSRQYFNKVCSSHTYDDKIATLKDALDAGLEICSGGIMGLGESMLDRIEMAFELRDLNVTSIPINFLNPIPHTPFATHPPITIEEAKRIIAIYRFIHPTSFIRLAGGRSLFKDTGNCLFTCGANATITGDMLTTQGISIKKDLETIKKLHYTVVNP